MSKDGFRKGACISGNFSMTSFLPLPLVAFIRRLMGAKVHQLALPPLPFSRVPLLSFAASTNGRRTTGRRVGKREEASKSLQMSLSVGRQGRAWASSGPWLSRSSLPAAENEPAAPMGARPGRAGAALLRRERRGPARCRSG